MERRRTTGLDPTDWLVAGDPDIDRDYDLFAMLAGVRNYAKVTPVAEPRGAIEEEDDCSSQYWLMEYEDNLIPWEPRVDWSVHDPSWLTLREMKLYVPRDNIPEQFRDRVEWLAAAERYMALVSRLSSAAEFWKCADEDFRLVFYFDN